MASEIRVNQIQNRSGLGTVTFSDTGVVIAGVTTVSGSLNVTGTVTSSSASTFSSGIVVAAGTTAAPSISPSGDSNTGIFFPSADTIAFGEGGSEAFRITSTGQLRATGASDVRLTLGSTGTPETNNSVHIRADGANLKFMSASGGVTLFESNGVESARFTASGNLAFPSGQGIDFSATANSSGTMTSELFDDYEVGTWTPSLTFNGVTTGITYTTREGYYTKIGNIVNIQWHIILSNKGSVTGNAVLSGNPFGAFISGGANNAGVVVLEGNGSSWVAGTYSLVWSDAGIYIRYNGSSSWSPVTNTSFTNTTDFYGSNTYRVS